MNVAYNRDCMDVMREYPDKYFDLAVVDPPYGIGIQSMSFTKEGPQLDRNAKARRRDYRRTDEWDIRPTQDYFDELFRVSGKQIIWGGNYFSDMLPPSKGFICWDKRVSDTVNDFADCEYAWLSKGLGVARMVRYRWNGMLQGDMKNKENRFHPTQKPKALYDWIFQHYAERGMKILDTHLGSGSSRLAAYDAGLDFVGCEIDKWYFDKQEERFAEYVAQASLFVDESAQAEQIGLWSDET